MPRQTESFSRSPKTRSGKYEKILDQLLDGQVWVMERGDDFPDKGRNDDGVKVPKVESVASRIRSLINQRGYGAVSVVVDEDTFEIQATEKKQVKTKKGDSDSGEESGEDEATTSTPKKGKGKGKKVTAPTNEPDEVPA